MSDFHAPALLRASDTHAAMAPSPDIGYSPCYTDLALGATPSPIPLAPGSGDLVVTSSVSGLGDGMGDVFTPLLGLSTTLTRLGSPRGLRRRRSSFSVADVPGSEATRSAVVLLASARIGEGSSGTAFSVANPIDRRRYVMKRVPVNDRSMESRLCNEPRLHGRLRHRHIVSYHYSWMEREEGDGGGASLCILLEKCVGELWGLVEESRLTPALAAKLTLQAAAAVKEMHECGIMHRDLSPWNIFLSDANDVRVGDLGLGAEIPRGGDGLLRGLEEPLDAMPLDSSALDSIYSAPELGSNGGYGAKVDVYSLGLLFLTLWGFALRPPSSSGDKNSPRVPPTQPDGNTSASPAKPNVPVDDGIFTCAPATPTHPESSSKNNNNDHPPSLSARLTRPKPRSSLLSSSSSPFSSDNVQFPIDVELLVEVVECVKRDPCGLPPFDPSLVPPALPPLIRRMVDHDPNQRPSAAEVCRYLEGAAERARGGKDDGKRSHSCTLS